MNTGSFNRCCQTSDGNACQSSNVLAKDAGSVQRASSRMWRKASTSSLPTRRIIMFSSSKDLPPARECCCLAGHYMRSSKSSPEHLHQSSSPVNPGRSALASASVSCPNLWSSEASVSGFSATKNCHGVTQTGAIVRCPQTLGMGSARISFASSVLRGVDERSSAASNVLRIKG